MATTKNFSWLDGVDLDDIENLYFLKNAVVNCKFGRVEVWGSFSCEMLDGGRYLVRGDMHSDSLLLASEKAKDYFLSLLDKRCPSDLGIEGQYQLDRAMEKND